MGFRIAAALIVMSVLASYHTEAEAFIGMNWGRQSAQRLVPSQVVDLLLQNGIKNARIYSTNEDILAAFGGSGINLTLTIYGAGIPGYPNAKAWFKKKSALILASHVTTVIVGGNYVFDRQDPTNTIPIEDAMATLLEVQKAFNDAGHGDSIKANFLHNTKVLIDDVRRPSDAEFRIEIRGKMRKFLQFLQEHNSPFLLDMFPIQDVHNSTHFNPSFAFADNKSNIVIKDINGAVYTNVFEWTYDCFAWALNKLNASTIKIVVSQVGWPTDGYDGANADNAERFFKHLLPLVASNKGTPMRPGAPIDVFIVSLTDEPKMALTRPFTRHWGIYRSNGQPKYKIDLSGQGRDIFPTMMKGIMRMPERWCVFNGNVTDLFRVRNQTELACKYGDCTTLFPSASCGNLTTEKNVTYAFNSFFQTFFQDEAACDFDGLAYVSDDDPSTDECVFPVEVVRGRQLIESKWTAANGVVHVNPNSAVLLLLLCMVGASSSLWT